MTLYILENACNMMLLYYIDTSMVTVVESFFIFSSSKTMHFKYLEKLYILEHTEIHAALYSRKSNKRSVTAY